MMASRVIPDERSIGPAVEPEGTTGADEQLADEVEAAVRRHPWVESTIRPGWFAKGVVYALMGVLAVGIALDATTPEDPASPEGALGATIDRPGGRLFLGVLGLGLVLYSAWRLMSVLVIRGWSTRAVLERVGYLFSAVFYLVLAWEAAQGALRGARPVESYTIEHLSAGLLGHAAGRIVVGAGGLVIVGVGLYFLKKALRREFSEHLVGVQPDMARNRGMARLIWLTGALGYAGRGLVTLMVGFFVMRAAIRFDRGDARGFDRTLRHVASGPAGSLLVSVAGCGLVVYGVYCLLSAPRREIAERSS